MHPAEPVKLELYYDSTVEPFETEGFNPARVLEIMEKLEKLGIQVKGHSIC